jgi:hypothetical protein
MKTFSYNDMTKADLEEFSDCYWGPPDEERYSHTELEEAIEAALDACDSLPATLELVAMRSRALSISDLEPELILEQALEYLDEEYGDPEGERTEPTEAMRQAAKALCEVVIRDYEVWTCYLAAKVIVSDPAEWVMKNCPEWGK